MNRQLVSPAAGSFRLPKVANGLRTKVQTRWCPSRSHAAMTMSEKILAVAWFAIVIAAGISSGYVWWFVLIGIVLAIIWLGITIPRWLGSPTILALDAAHAARDRLERERATGAGAGASAPREQPSAGGSE
jgi:hypothetical protein